MFRIGIQELIIILVIALIIFGPKRLPELAKAIGQSLLSFKKGLKEIEDDVSKDIREEIHK